MDFDSPDVEKEFPGLYASESGLNKKKEESDFSEGDHERVSKKELLIGRRKDKKDKKDRGYATLEGESSPEEDIETKSPFKGAKKSKAFKFSSKSKEKREKSREKDKGEKEPRERDKETFELKDKKKEKEKKDKDKKEKKEKDKDKDKKEKKSKQASICEEVLELGDVQPVFGVSVSLATERSRCHDGVDLPLVVRDCIDYLQEHGLQSEQIYKVEPLKSRIQHLKRQYNNRESPCINELDIPTACGLLKQFLKELPEPVLTTDLIARFEEVASQPNITQQEQNLHVLLEQLPGCNKTLLSWVLLHFDSIIQNEKANKMNAQSLAMLLSPTLQMSHRLLVTLLCHCPNLCTKVKLVKYVPPITSSSPKLPETSSGIQKELLKQESLLAQIHAEMNAGFVSKKREEQLWEVQRIITQLKRKLRTFEKKQDSITRSVDDTVDGEIITESASATHVKSKLSYSDDESVKTAPAASNESATNTETKSTPQEMPDIPTVILEGKAGEQRSNVSPDDGTRNPDSTFLHESGLLMLADNHPEYLNLIRIQLENQELLQWKSQLQIRINAERAEILRLKKLLALAEAQQQQQGKGVKPLSQGVEDGDYEKIIEHFLKENTLLEHKRVMLAKEIFEENKDLVQLQVELTLQGLRP